MKLRIQTDEQTRRLYANDASMYEELPAAIAFPMSVAECAEAVQLATAQGWSVTARAAGTSLAGQTTGAGLVIDTGRHLNRILNIDSAQHRATVQPGVIRDALNRATAPLGLHFAPDTATTDRCMIGGMIGNNSAGLYSGRYGVTSDHVHAMQVILQDGSSIRVGPLPPDELAAKQALNTFEGQIYRQMLALLTQHEDLIRRAYPHPSIIRRNTGYALDRLLRRAPFTPDGPPFSLVELLCGSEGTLALTVEAELKLTPLPRYRVLVAPHFETVYDAVVANIEAVRHGAAASELMDRLLLQTTHNNLVQQRNRFFITGDPGALLLVEFHGDTEETAVATARSFQAHCLESGQATAAPLLLDAHDVRRAWALRKAGLGLLMGLWSDVKTPEFMEDSAVRVEDLPAFILDIEALMQRHETRCVYYGHASVGELHIRPEIRLGTTGGIKTLKAMAEEMAILVHQYGGSLSGEHGDGRVRAPYIQRVLGTDLMPVLHAVKDLWDPQRRLNPGKIVHAPPIDQALRVRPETAHVDVATRFHWRDQPDFTTMLDRCNGAGVCRKLAASGGTMCPSYMATREERDSTRGRANLFRQLFRGRQAGAFAAPELHDALSLCLSCKACKSECPANVDMARMKAEFLNGWHRHHPPTRADRLYAFPDRMLAWTVYLPKSLLNRMDSRSGRNLLHRLIQWHPDRSLPAVAPKRLYRRPITTVPQEITEHVPVLFWNDFYTDRLEPTIGHALLRVMEALGIPVTLQPPRATGRTAITGGFLDQAEKIMIELLTELDRPAFQDRTWIGTEPSELLTIRDDWIDLAPEKYVEQAKDLARRTFLVEEYFLRHLDRLSERCDGRGQRVYIHSHCHARALTDPTMQAQVLAAAGFDPVLWDTGCCGMAGAFGLRAETYSLSMQIGEQRLFPAVRTVEDEALICASGFSCRHQIRDGTGRRALHLIECIASALRPR